jgi:hypothetical protein
VQLLLERAAAIKKKVFGADHPNTNYVYCHLASLLLRMGSPNEAYDLAQHTLSNQDRMLGPNHPRTQYSASITAEALDTLGRTKEASALREKYGLTPEAPSAS